VRELFTSFETITKATFNSQALKLFRFQYEKNSIYRSYCDLINVDPSDVNEINKIPFLPIQFFKTHDLNFDKSPPQIKFESSRTTGQTPSIHNVNDLNLYIKSF
jgi:phenylacetate-coenzyme A ligase PaaK-like adenylate-forming protein